MSQAKIVTEGNLSINIADVKCIKVESITNSNEKKAILIFEFKSRYEYVFNPATKEYEKIQFNDKTISEFSDFEMATAYQRDWESIWQDYLDESKK